MISHYPNIKSLREITDKNQLIKSFFFYLKSLGLKSKYLHTYKDYVQKSVYYNNISCIYNFIYDYYDDREETDKDVWNYKRIVGSNISFLNILLYYRETVKRYLKTLITKRSFSHCYALVRSLGIFFNYFYDNKFGDGFLSELYRKQIENFLYYHASEFKNISSNARSARLFQIRSFLKYIQYAEYSESPKTAIDFLIFDEDMVKRETYIDTIKRAKFVPEEVIKQIDNNIMALDNQGLIY